MNMSPAERAVRKARARVVQLYPFFGALILRQQLIETEVLPGGAFNHTMATDGKHIYFNPDWALAQRPEHLQFVVAHEGLHPGLNHHTRRGDRDPGVWNEAGDYVINPVLKDSGMHMPPDALYDPRFQGMTAEKVYAQLASERPQQKPDQGDGDPQPGQGGESPSDAPGDAQGQGDAEAQGQGGSPQNGAPGPAGQVLDAPVGTEEERKAEEREWKTALKSAAEFAAGGRIPASARELIDGLLEPRVSWDEILRQFMDQFARADYSWRAPNRRFVGHGMYLPSLRSEQLPPMCLVVDASSSMPRDKLREVVSEVQVILDDFKPEFLDVIVHNTQVTNEFRFEPGDTVELDIRASGGTEFAPAFQWIADSQEDYAAILYFTDMETWSWSGCIEPQAPLVWIDYCGRYEPPFGDEHIVMEDA